MNLFNVGDHLALNFVHKRLLGAAKSFVTSGFNPLALAGGFLRPTAVAPPVRRPLPAAVTARPSARGAAEKEMGRAAKFASDALPTRALTTTKRPTAAVPVRTFGIPCIPPFFLNEATGKCELDLVPGPGGGGTGRRRDNGSGGGMGEAVMGRYGAAVVPGSRMIDRAVCARGMQLGDDGLCYNKGQISNRQRMWPAGRKPLLTGGEMRAITVAATAGRRLERATKRLQKIGLMKKPPPRRKVVTSGPDHHHHS